MNVFVADPQWGWWIILYFYLGGMAAGAYFMATLIDLLGTESDRPLARIGFWIAFPLISVCGLFLIADLDRPLRFWHMLFRSEVVKEAFGQGWPFSGTGWATMIHAPLLKYWSPMSVGSWALVVFGACSLCSFLGSMWEDCRLNRLFRRSRFAYVLEVVGCLVGFFIAAYTGTLMSATNQPVWSDSTWIAPLFLTSAGSTGIAAILLIALRQKRVSHLSVQRLERADVWALGLELGVFAIFLASLGPVLVSVLGTWHGKLLIGGTLLVGVLAPLAIHLRMGFTDARGPAWASVLVLVGGFVLRYGLLTTPPEVLARPSAPPGFGPEDGRARGGGRGADPGNYPAEVEPRSKVYREGTP